MKVEIDAEVLQHLCETALVHEAIIDMLLGLEESRFPGFADAARAELDRALGRRAHTPIDAGMVNMRARLLDTLAAAKAGAAAEPRHKGRTALRQWLFGWPFQRRG